MNLKSSKSGFKNDCVHCCVIGYYGNALLHFGLNTKVSCEGLLGGGIEIILKQLYLISQ